MVGRRGAVEPVVIYTAVVAVLLIIIVALSFALIGKRRKSLDASAGPASGSASLASGDDVGNVSEVGPDVPGTRGLLSGAESNDTVDAIHGRVGRTREAMRTPVTGQELPFGEIGNPGLRRRTAPISSPQEFQAYLTWLGLVDAQRHHVMGRGYATVQLLVRGSGNSQQAVMEANRAMLDFTNHLRSGKPRVPVDCVSLDRDYAAGSDGELRVMVSMVGQARDGVQPSVPGGPAATRLLANADDDLVSACELHGMQPPIRIRPE